MSDQEGNAGITLTSGVRLILVALVAVQSRETQQQRHQAIALSLLSAHGCSVKKDTAAETAKKREQERARQEKLEESRRDAARSRYSRYSRSRSRSYSRSPPRGRGRDRSRSRSPSPR